MSTTDDTPTDQLTDDERETFENLREFDDEKVRELAELVLQSDREDANS